MKKMGKGKRRDPIARIRMKSKENIMFNLTT